MGFKGGGSSPSPPKTIIKQIPAPEPPLDHRDDAPEATRRQRRLAKRSTRVELAGSGVTTPAGGSGITIRGR